MADNLITLAEAAVRLHLPYYAAHRLALAGDLGPVQRVGGRYWFLDPGAIQGFIDERAKSATSSTLATDAASRVGSSPMPPMQVAALPHKEHGDHHKLEGI